MSLAMEETSRGGAIYTVNLKVYLSFRHTGFDARRSTAHEN